MRYTKFLCFVLVSLAAVNAFSKKPKDKNKYGVYIAGVSASFTDSLVYFTNIQYVDSASVNDKGLLVGRADYSQQLKAFLESDPANTNRTCFVYFNTNKRKLEKEVYKLKQNYAKGGSLVLKDVETSFQFKKAEIY